MKRLLIAVTLAFAFSATSAMAAPIPHNDDNPDNWGAVYNLNLCDGEPCEFSATSTDTVLSLTVNGVPYSIPPCPSVTVFYEMAPYGTAFDWADADYDGAGCPWTTSSSLPLETCVYSPSGFANGSSDVELWFRVYANSTEPDGYFAKATGDAVGTYVHRFTGYGFDQQESSGPAFEASIDGNYDVDGDPVLVEHNLGATPCGYPELS